MGYGHGELDWRRFVSALRLAGYDDVLSIEHEDALLSIEEGFEKGVAFLRSVMPSQPPYDRGMVDMSADRLKAAVIGTGFVGPFHVDAVRRGGYGEVAVVVGSDPERTRRRADALGVAHATADLAAVIDDPQIDVVHVCTPDSTHVDIARRALKAGKHVVVEKPLASTGADARSLVQLARDCGLHAAVAFTYRGYPMVRRARQAIADGEAGSVRLIHGAYLQDWLANETDYNWRLEAPPGGSRAVADIGSHWFDTAEYVTGTHITSVFADFATFLEHRQRPTARTAAFEGPTGAE